MKTNSEFDTAVLDNLNLVGIFSKAKLNVFNDLENYIFYKSKDVLDKLSGDKYVHLNNEDFDILAKNDLIKITSQMETYVLGTIDNVARSKILDMLEGMLAYVLKTDWRWVAFSASDNKIMFLIDVICFGVAITSEVIDGTSIKLAFTSPTEGIKLDNIKIKDRKVTESAAFNSVLNSMMRMGDDHSDKITRKIIETITLNAGLRDKILDVILDGKMFDWRDYIDSNLLPDAKGNVTTPSVSGI